MSSKVKWDVILVSFLLLKKKKTQKEKRRCIIIIPRAREYFQRYTNQNY